MKGWVAPLIQLGSVLVLMFALPFAFIWSQPWWGLALFVLALLGLMGTQAPD